MVATAIADTQLLKISASFDLLTVLGLIVLGVILAMGASLLTALPASSEKPMSVLRYE
jgi:ABC-type lipoprotein release transport system permease subunit